MAKKKQRKKHLKKQVARTAPIVQPASVPTEPVAGVTQYAYVAVDLRRIGWLVVIFLIAQVGLWLLLNQTAWGQRLYDSFRL
jgi:ABC-type uncharacterized transport system permease subunit